MTETIKPSAEKIIQLYKSIDKSEKQLASLAFEVSETPLKGFIKGLDPEPRVYKLADGREQKYFVYIVTESKDSDKEIGELSVNRAFDSFVKEGDFLIVSNPLSPNKDKAMLRSHRLTNTNAFGKSRAEQIASLVGCEYEAERVTGNTVTEYTDKMFCEAPKGKPAVASLKALWSNTSVNEKLMKFTTLIPA